MADERVKSTGVKAGRPRKPRKRTRITARGTSPQETARLERRAKVAKLYTDAWTMPEIAAELKIALGTVHNDVKAVEEAWKAEAIMDFDAYRRRTVRQLDRMIRDAIVEWERSKQDAVETIDEGIRPDAKVDPKTGAVVSESTATSVEELLQRKRRIKRHGQCGDPRYVRAVRDLIAERTKTLGAYLETGTGEGENPAGYVLFVPGETPPETAEQWAKIFGRTGAPAT